MVSIIMSPLRGLDDDEIVFYNNATPIGVTCLIFSMDGCDNNTVVMKGYSKPRQGWYCYISPTGAALL